MEASLYFRSIGGQLPNMQLSRSLRSVGHSNMLLGMLMQPGRKKTSTVLYSLFYFFDTGLLK